MQPLSPSLRVAQAVARTSAEGPGERFALWLQGCPLRCPGCCNPEMLPFEGGSPTSVEELFAWIVACRGIEGITLMGGEPFAQAAPLALLCERVREAGLGVMVFSGYPLSTLRALGSSAAQRLLAATDLLVDGPYLRSRPERTRRWIGSENQEMHFLSSRYDPSDECFRASNGFEVRLSPTGLCANGWPSALRELLDHGDV